MARQRPLAGQRGRSRPGTAVLDGAPGSGAEITAHPAPDEPTGPPSSPPGPASRRPRRPRRLGRADLLVLVAALVAVALALTAGLLAVRARGEDRAERGRTEALAAAEAHAVDLLSYDYRHLDRDFARARRALTGSFAADYATTTDEVVRPTAGQVKAVVKADVAASSVVRGSQNRVVVLLFVNQTTTSTRLDGPRIDLNRVRLTLDRVDGRWLVSRVVAL